MATKPLIGLNGDFRPARKDAIALSWFNTGYYDSITASKIKTEIESGNLGIQNLQVAYNDGNCTLSGTCPSAEAMQKAVLLAGNVQGVKNVDIAGLQA